MMNAPLRVLSWQVKFPRYDLFEGKYKSIDLNKMRQGSPGSVSAVEGMIFENVKSKQSAFDRDTQIMEEEYRTTLKEMAQ